MRGEKTSELNVTEVKKRQRKKHFDDAIAPTVHEVTEGGQKIGNVELPSYPQDEAEKMKVKRPKKPIFKTLPWENEPEPSES